MITYKKGDLLKSDCNVICHQVNCRGVMGAGIALAIRNKYPEVYQRFIQRYQQQGSHLGDLDIIAQQENNQERFIVNLYSQDDYFPRNVCHTDYDAFRQCLIQLKMHLLLLYYNTCLECNEKSKTFKIGFPDHIGCGLAGGDWNIIKRIIEKEFSDQKWNVEIWKLT